MSATLQQETLSNARDARSEYGSYIGGREVDAEGAQLRAECHELSSPTSSGLPSFPGFRT